MLAIGALAVAFRGLHELLARDPAVLVGDLLHDRDGQSLCALYGAHAPINELFPTQAHKLMEEQSMSGSAQTTLPSALTLLGFCAPDRIQRNIAINSLLITLPKSVHGHTAKGEASSDP